MKKSMKTVCLLILLVFSFSQLGFSQYAQLVGKRVELHGPFCWDTLGVALDEQTCDLMIQVSRMADKKLFKALLKATEIIRVDKNAKVLVLDTEIFEGRAKVVILTGTESFKGMSGWIPIDWLKGNDKLPRFSDMP